MARWKMFKQTATAVGGALTYYLGQQVVDYREVQKSLQNPDLETSAPERAQVTATKKEWYLFGRQSPHYVRDMTKTPKHEEHRKIEESSLYLKRFGTVMDNEKHYDLFEGSDFEIEPISSNSKYPKVIVPPEAMLSDRIDELDDDARFEIHFARKRGFADISEKSPFFHSSIALRVIPEEETPDPSTVVVSGSEIKKILKGTEETVCKTQHCNLYTSNCYSASIFSLEGVIKTINEREGVEKSSKKEDIAKVAQVLQQATTDNLSRGISNNSLIKSSLIYDIHPILLNYGLVQKTKAEDEYGRTPPPQM
ncbi:hypothetical protein EP47_07085 [Legionella norrlandica]|uniref:Uncharacterized protein n=1 Tax=Legionella norrlandica TaxID=1498499 RepID=A0A0A2SS37_9GAMM|nr:hypothetical protein [Legionella norrlandica]KGP63895.1 hypothetical protein EP47_07085 [Legionella norrlandica]